ncbi:MAG: hypothetical protein K0R05_3841 [Anaerocolumna sp.]|jgi:hypothetical protein|nr:hypothetical protein [Anaerocolumna sp.]
MKREKKNHPVLFAMKIAAFLLFIVIPILAWKTGQNCWSGLYCKERKQ